MQDKIIKITHNSSVTKLAEMMKESHVGCVLVVEKIDSSLPIGLVTDRDIVIKVVANNIDPETITVENIMTRQVKYLNYKAEIHEAIQLMKDEGIRRLPLVDDSGSLVGIVTVDDLIHEFSEDLEDLSEIIEKEIKNESKEKIHSRRLQ